MMIDIIKEFAEYILKCYFPKKGIDIRNFKTSEDLQKVIDEHIKGAAEEYTKEYCSLDVFLGGKPTSTGEFSNELYEDIFGGGQNEETF